MRFTYPVIVKETGEGKWRADFPDLEMCFAEGDSLDDVLRNANAAAYDWIALELSEDDPVMPPSSHIDDLELAEGEIARNILIIYRFLEGYEE